MQQWLCRLAFIECMIHRDDCSKELLEWGSRVQGAPLSVMWHVRQVSQHCRPLNCRAHTKRIQMCFVKLGLWAFAA